MSDLSGPIDEADEADVAEQNLPLEEDVDDEEVTTPPAVTPDEANEADAAEQRVVVTGDDEDYPHGS